MRFYSHFGAMISNYEPTTEHYVLPRAMQPSEAA